MLLNLVATRGHVGIRSYKDFDFGNEQVTSPWHMGYIGRNEGYQSLAIPGDWRFTTALWDEDGKLTLEGTTPILRRNPPAKARVHVRGTLDEVQTLVEVSGDQTADVFQVIDRLGTPDLASTPRETSRSDRKMTPRRLSYTTRRLGPPIP
jgi:hypothetical protein